MNGNFIWDEETEDGNFSTRQLTICSSLEYYDIWKKRCTPCDLGQGTVGFMDTQCRSCEKMMEESLTEMKGVIGKQICNMKD